MKRILLGVLLLLVTACGREATAPPLFSAAASTLHLAHGAFSTAPGGQPIGHAATYLYVGSTTVPMGDAQAPVGIPVGQPINGLSASVYLDTTGLTGGSARIIDVTLWRVGYAVCAVFGYDPKTDLGPSPYARCPVAWTSAQTGSATVGWSVKSSTSPSGSVEAGFTYEVVANLRGDIAPLHRIRLGYVDIAYGTTPAPAFAVVPLTGPTRARLILAARQLMP